MQNQITLSPSKTLTAEIKLFEQFSAALDLKVRSQEIARNTAVSYMRGAGRFIDWRRTQGNTQNLTDTIREWKSELLSADYKPGTICTWLAGVRSLFAWATETGIIQYNPAASIKGATRKGTQKRHARESLSDTEARRLLAIPDTETIGGKRDAAILAMMLYTAIRGVELHRANADDLQTQGGRLVLFVQGKGHHEKDDFVVVSHAESALRDWLGVRDPKSPALFQSISNRTRAGRLSLQAYRHLIKHYMRLAGVTGNKTTHSLRHTAITAAIKAGVPIQRVSKEIARHVSIDTTLIYYHEMERLDDPAEDHISY